MSTLVALAFILLTVPAQLHGGGVPNWRIYYGADGRAVPILYRDLLRSPSLIFGTLPCSCDQLTCGCCAHINLFSENRNGCLNFTYVPEDFAIDLNFLVNEESIYQNSISGKNPPPGCLNTPIPYLPSVGFCIRLYDIYTEGTNIHSCVNFETTLINTPVLVLQFDCFMVGSDGFSFSKPTQLLTNNKTML